jgi:hypothetical protein
MAVICPRCGRQYDPTLFEFGRRVPCECGRILEGGHTLEVGGGENPPRRGEAPEKDGCPEPPFGYNNRSFSPDS